MVEQWMSDELKEVTFQLTGQQWAGIIKIVQAELDGRTLNSLLLSPDRPCTKTTYYGRWSKKKRGTKSNPGWVDNAYFVQALAWARRDYRSWLMEQGTSEAMQVLAKAAAPSARELERQVVGDVAAIEALGRQLDRAVEAGREGHIIKLAQALGASQLSEALPALVRALDHEWGAETTAALIGAVGNIASPLDADRQKASTAILDRAGEATAAKAVTHETGSDERTHKFDLRDLPKELVEFFASFGQGAGQGFGDGGEGGTE